MQRQLVGFCSEYVSSILVGWITVLSQQATQTIQVNRNHKLHLKNDTYSLGVSAELIMSYPSADAHNITKSIPFSSVLIRERCRPDSSLTTAELYLVLAMAAKHRMLPDVRSINLRLLIVYSHWVQVLNVTTTVPYIASIVDGQADIADKMIIHRTSWFNFLDGSGQLQALLSTFEGIELEPHMEPNRAMRTQVPLQEITTNASRQRSKRRFDNGEELDNQRSKSQRVSYKQASRGSQDVP
ncbi:hypothetical protein BJ878DRAFT_155844 [Calycina marina]|uniref:Uncharacterized protein n=1 Tax=Calycina marina TaxID=1763456 RepID=A0A9P7Z0A6_9HELO|nr:hypothetical protein BJ878DRAFT_155844 [Calycina marina]